MSLWGLPLPGFLGIGAMRAGTSWFAAHLARHPALYLYRKEIHFFDRKLERRRVPLLADELEARLRYGLRFLPAKVLGRMAGEFTPSYALLDRDRIVTIQRWMPDLKLLFIMRDPIERAWSQAQHDYASFLGRDAASAPESELRAFLERPGVRRRGDYATCLETWMSVFPREQFFLTFLEDVRLDAARVLRTAFAFLGIDRYVAFDASVTAPLHRSAGTAIPDGLLTYLTETLRPDDARLEAIVGRRLPWVTPPEPRVGPDPPELKLVP